MRTQAEADQTNVIQLFGAPVLREQARTCLAARQDLRRRLSPGLVSDPVLDTLLKLFAAAGGQEEVSMLSCSAATGVGLAATIRWIEVLVQEGLVVLHKEAVSLTNKGISITRLWLEGCSGLSPRAEP